MGEIKIEVEIKSTLTRRNYFNLLVLSMFHSTTFYFFITLIFAFFLYAFFRKSSFAYPIIFLAVSLLFCVIWFIYTISLSPNRIFFSEKYFKFREDNISLKTAKVERIIQWEAIKKWRKLSGYYILELSSGWLVISRSDIPTNAVISFEDLLLRKIDKISIIRPVKEN
jgi:hypothetical protein